MTSRSRVLAFGSAGVLVLVGAICAVFVNGLTGEVLAIGLITLGIGGALLLTFLEVGLSEERQLAMDEERRRRRAEKRAHAGRRLRLPRRPRRPS